MEGPLTRGMLPLAALPSELAIRQTRTEDGFRDDPVAVRQLEVIRRLLREADGAVTATAPPARGSWSPATFMAIWASRGKPNACGFPR